MSNCPYQPNEEPVYRSSDRPMGAFGTSKTVSIYYKHLPTAQGWPGYVDRRLQENRGIQRGNNMPNGWKMHVLDGADAASLSWMQTGLPWHNILYVLAPADQLPYNSKYEDAVVSIIITRAVCTIA